MLGFLYQDQGEEEDDGEQDDEELCEEEDDGECSGEGQGLVRELFHVILICDGSSPLESQHSNAYRQVHNKVYSVL